MTGLLAGFDTEQALRRALERFRAERVDDVETYTPVALDEDPTGSPLPLLMFAAGMLGFIGFFLLMTYADVVSYPIDIGGRPRFAWPAFVPIAFELAALCAMGAGFVGWFLASGLPRLYDPIDECESFRAATRDGWFLAIRDEDPATLARARALLDELRPAVVESIP